MRLTRTDFARKRAPTRRGTAHRRTMEHHTGKNVIRSKRKQTLSIQARKSGHLVLGVRKTIDELNDPSGICVDKRAVQGIGPGMPTMIILEGATDIDNTMEILRQV